MALPERRHTAGPSGANPAGTAPGATPPAADRTAAERTVAARTVAVLSVAVLSGILVAALAVLIATPSGVLPRFDLAVHESVRAYGLAHPAWLSTMRLATHLGDTVVVATVDAIVCAACVWQRRRRAALFVAVTSIGVWAVRTVVREVVARPRPADAAWPADQASFPSGHTTNSAAMVAIIGMVCWPLLHRTGRMAMVVAGSAYVLAVGFSRVAGGVHWPTDVLGGLLLACTLVSLSAGLHTALGHRRRGRPNPPDAPGKPDPA